MSENTQFKAPTDTAARVHRREFLFLAPSAALASSIPPGLAWPRPLPNPISISDSLIALWDHSGEGSGSILAERHRQYLLLPPRQNGRTSTGGRNRMRVPTHR
jgi:hypothetical protein